MNIFSRVREAITRLLNRKVVEHALKQDRPKVSTKFSHVVQLRPSNGLPVFGPSFVPSPDFHWVSRQTCRHYLRTRAFHFISSTQPLMSRRDRRRFSRAMAGIEYIDMMSNKQNLVDNEKALLTGEAAA